MKTGTGVVSILVALGALMVSSANTKTAEARSGSAHSVQAPAQLEAPAQALDVTSDDVASPAEPDAPPSLENPKLRRMLKAEISPAMLQVAAQVVRQYYAKPVGTQVEVDVDGKHVYARIERHFHPDGGPVKPWGFHPGVSLFIAR